MQGRAAESLSLVVAPLWGTGGRAKGGTIPGYSQRCHCWAGLTWLSSQGKAEIQFPTENKMFSTLVTCCVI